MNVNWFGILHIQKTNGRNNLTCDGIFNQFHHSDKVLHSINNSSHLKMISSPPPRAN